MSPVWPTESFFKKTSSNVCENCGGIWLLMWEPIMVMWPCLIRVYWLGNYCISLSLSDGPRSANQRLQLTRNSPWLALHVNSTWRFLKTQLQLMLHCGRWRTRWHNGWLGLWLLDQAFGTGGFWSRKDHLPPQVYRQQVQPQVHDHSGHWLQRKTSGEWCSGCSYTNLNVLPTAWRMELRSMGNAFV